MLVLAVATSVTAQTGNPKSNQSPSGKDKMHEMAKKGGGHFVFRYRPSRARTFADLTELAAHSDVVVIGRTLTHHPSLSAGGNMITNDFEVKIQEVFKGKVTNGTTIVVKVPGGAYKFPDGTRAAVLGQGYKEPQDRQMYAFFLKRRANSKDYRLISEAQGLFALTSSGVEPADLEGSDPVVVNYRGRSSSEFLSGLHQAVQKPKK
jgi:hypothetical protein